MAQKRMFSNQIVDSDAFLEMPQSSQNLYFHLNMRADDDGFIDKHKTIMRMVGASEDDLKILIAKRFLIGFERGVVVIKHWRIHNTIQKDRYKPTVYQEEYQLLIEKQNKGYTELKNEKCFQNVNRMETQTRLDKIRLDNTMSEKSDAPSPFDTFWNSYPKKELKKKSLEIWKRKKLDPHLQEILTFIEKAKRTDRWKKGFVKQPTTFLNNESWNDDLASYGDQSSPPPQTMNYKTVDEIMAEKGLVNEKIGTNHFDRSELTQSKRI